MLLPAMLAGGRGLEIKSSCLGSRDMLERVEGGGEEEIEVSEAERQRANPLQDQPHDA